MAYILTKHPRRFLLELREPSSPAGTAHSTHTKTYHRHPLSKSPLTLDNRHNSPGATIKGEMGFGAIVAKKEVSSAKSVYSKNCVSGSQGRWTLCFSMEAIKSLKPLEHTKSRKYGQNAGIGTYIPMGPQSPYNMAYTKIAGPIVSVYKHTYFRSSPPFDPKSIMLAYWHVYKKAGSACVPIRQYFIQ